MSKSGQAPIGQSAAMADDLFEGTPYRGVRRLGRGGMSELFLVVHRGTRREFVAKVLRASMGAGADPQLVDRFRLEGQAHGLLSSHSNVVTVAGLGTTSDGRPFLVLERLDGRTLSEELAERGKLPVLEALTFVLELLSALEAAHSLGIVHRDIKPDNLFLCSRGGRKRRLKVLDFGIARVMPSAPAGTPKPLAVPTDTGTVIGTPRFASPELALTQRDIDGRGDVYSAALVLYLMIVGRGPFDDIRDAGPLLIAHAQTEPERPSHFADEPVPPELDRAIMRALRKDRTERFQSAEEFRKVLESVANDLAKPAGWLETSAFAPLCAHEPAMAEETHMRRDSRPDGPSAEPAWVIDESLARARPISESGPRIKTSRAETPNADATARRSDHNDSLEGGPAVTSVAPTAKTESPAGATVVFFVALVATALGTLALVVALGRALR